MAQQLVKSEGLMVGYRCDEARVWHSRVALTSCACSAGAAISGVVSYCKEKNLKDAVVVTVLPDNGTKYISKGLFSKPGPN